MQLSVIIFRRLGFYVAPVFLFLNLSANTVSVLGLVVGLFSAGLIFYEYIISGIIFYVLVSILDHVDGTIARAKGQATFYGRFLDGLFGIITISCVNLSLAALIENNGGPTFIVWLGIISAVLIPLYSLILDRYSTFVRWIKEEGNKIETKPYLRPKMSSLINILSDAQYIIIFALPFYFLKNYWTLVLCVYFLIWILMGLYTLFYATKSASKNFRISANPHR